jgi:hypothetical protein
MNLNGKVPVFAIANKKWLLFGVESQKKQGSRKAPKTKVLGAFLSESFMPNEP